jgi:hypothetical protein
MRAHPTSPPWSRAVGRTVTPLPCEEITLGQIAGKDLLLLQTPFVGAGPQGFMMPTFFAIPLRPCPRFTQRCFRLPPPRMQTGEQPNLPCQPVALGFEISVVITHRPSFNRRALSAKRPASGYLNPLPMSVLRPILLTSTRVRKQVRNHISERSAPHANTGSYLASRSVRILSAPAARAACPSPQASSADTSVNRRRFSL